MIVNFQTAEEFEYFLSHQPTPCWIFHTLEQVEQYCEESGIDDERFLDLEKNKKYFCKDFKLEEEL